MKTNDSQNMYLYTLLFSPSERMWKELPHVIFLVSQRSGYHRLHRRSGLFQPLHCLLPAGSLDHRVSGDVQGHQDVSEGEAAATFQMLNSLSKMYLLCQFSSENVFFSDAYLGKFGGCVESKKTKTKGNVIIAHSSFDLIPVMRKD